MSLGDSFQGRYIVPFLATIVVLVLFFEAIELSMRGTSVASVDTSELSHAMASLHAKLDAANTHALSLEEQVKAMHAKFNGMRVSSSDVGTSEQNNVAVRARPALVPSASHGRHAPASPHDLAPTGKRFHFVFSADCRYPPKVHWQSVVLLYSFFATQPHTSVISEVLSCHDTKWKPYWHDYFTPEEQARVRYHVAPARNPHPVTHDEYAPYNKPAGLLDWVRNTGGPYDYDIVIMIDWDNVMLRPFPVELLTEVQDRKPQAALYGIGTVWATNEIATNTCLDWCSSKTADDIEAVGAAGSPHAWTARDFREVLPLWQNYTEHIRATPAARERAGWMAEMYGYLLGALKLGFRHKIHPHWMLSSSHPFEWTDDLVPPLVLHYCQIYHLGSWHFYKYDLSAHDALSCDFPLLEPPPRALGVDTLVPNAASGDVWIVHNLVMYVNRAFIWYKERACKDSWPGKDKPRWKPMPDDVGEMVGAPGGTWMLRGP